MDAQTADVTKQVADYVRYWRMHSGMSVVDAALRSGITRSRWTEIEQAKSPLAKPDTLAKVARAIDRDPAELLAMVGIEAPGARQPNVFVSGTPAAVLELLDQMEQKVQRIEDRVRALEQSGDPPPHPAEPSSTPTPGGRRAKSASQGS